MLISILGTHALGKTTYCTSLVKRLPEVGVLLGDSSRLLIGNTVKHLAWCSGSVADKKVELEEYIADDTRVYVSEGCRFYSGRVLGVLQELYDLYNGGVKIINITTTAAIMLSCMRERCNRMGKTFKNAYWESRAEYYAFKRIDNAVARYVPSAPVYALHFGGDYDTFWDGMVHPLVCRIAKERWYGNCSN